MLLLCVCFVVVCCCVVCCCVVCVVVCVCVLCCVCCVSWPGFQSMDVPLSGLTVQHLVSVNQTNWDFAHRENVPF